MFLKALKSEAPENIGRLVLPGSRPADGKPIPIVLNLNELRSLHQKVFPNLG